MQLKKITAGLLSVLLAGALLAGCSTGETASSNASKQPESSAAAEKRPQPNMGRHGICHAAFFHAGNEKSRRVFFDATALLDCV